MLSTSMPRIVGEAEEQARQNDVHLPRFGCSLGTEQTSYCESFHEGLLTPGLSHDFCFELPVSVSELSSENDHSPWDAGLGIDM